MKAFEMPKNLKRWIISRHWKMVFVGDLGAAIAFVN
jgi:hypothetical protein